MSRLNQRFHTQVSWTSQCCGPCAFTIWGLSLLFFGGILVALSYVGPQITKLQLEKGVKQNVIWQPNSPEQVYRKFSGFSPSQTGHMKFYFWNITNTEDVKNGMIPNVTQVGPFCYEMYDRRYNEMFDLKGNVHFNDYQHYSEQLFFDDCMNETTVITTANLALLGILNGLKSLPISAFVKDLISSIINQMDGDIFMQRPVKELLWGYTDPILKEIVSRFGFLYPSLNGIQHVELVHNMTSLDEALAKPQDIINTGLHNISNIMQYQLWHNVSSITSWNNSVEQVRGTDAHQFTPGLTPQSVLPVWTADLYRVADFVYQKKVQYQGIDLYRFVPSDSLFEINPDYDQEIYGLLNITGPKAAGPQGDPNTMPGPQVLVSLPNFCKADPMLLEQVNGLDCEDSEDQLYLDVEPTLGTTMYAKIRLQMSTYISPEWSFEKNIPDTVVPIFWTEQLGYPDESDIQQFKEGVMFAQTLIKQFERLFVIGIVVASLSIVLFGGALYGMYACCCWTPHRGKDSKFDEDKYTLLLDKEEQTENEDKDVEQGVQEGGDEDGGERQRSQLLQDEEQYSLLWNQDTNKAGYEIVKDQDQEVYKGEQDEKEQQTTYFIHHDRQSSVQPKTPSDSEDEPTNQDHEWNGLFGSIRKQLARKNVGSDS